MELKDFNSLNFKGQSLILDLNASGVSYIITCREKDETETKEFNGMVQSVSTGRKIPDGFKQQGYNADTVIRLYRDPENPDVVLANYEKDRLKLHTPGEVVEYPSILDYQPILDGSAAKQNVVIKNGLNDAVKTEVKLNMRDLGINDEEPATASNDASSAKPTASALIDEINKAIGSVKDPVKRQKAKAALESAGLPTAFSKLKDVDTLMKIKEVVEKTLG